MEKFKKSPYIFEYKTNNGDYIYLNTYSNKILKICKKEKNEFEKVLTTPNEQEYKCLMENGILVNEDFDIEVENQKLLNEYYSKKERLYLIILPTEGCNFRCKYCYENHEVKKMTEKTIDRLINFVRRKLPEYKYLQVEWFGGEPLTEINMVTKITRELRNLCKKYKKPYFSSMTTNGYTLNREVFKTMFSNKVTNYQITLDGVALTHDQYRPLASGKGSFDVILNNLKRIRDEEKSQFIRVNIRCNITKPILNHFNEYIEMLENEFVNDIRFGIFWKIAWNPTLDDKNNEYCESGTLEALLQKYQSRKLRFSPYIGQFTRNGMVCYGGDPNSFVFRSDGTISKCTVAFDDDVNNLGSFENHEDVVNYNNFDHWTKHEMDPICSNCYLFPSCMGIHCPRNNRDKNGKRVCPNIKENNSVYLECIAKNKEMYMELHDLWKTKN